eukprot:SAG22_NODE_539_length_9317_cov_4.771209_7_plen_83_part_00
MTMAIAQSWVLDKIYIYIYNNHPKMKKEEINALVEISDNIHKQKQMKDDLEKIKGIISPIFYEPYGDDEEYINDIKQITKKY